MRASSSRPHRGAAALVALAACASDPAPNTPQAQQESIACPAPIGPVVREDCKAIAVDFGVLSALKKARPNRQDADAARATGELGDRIKSARVALCEQKNACKVGEREASTTDQMLTDAMQQLLDEWHARNRSAGDLTAYRAGLDAIAKRIAGAPVVATDAPSTASVTLAGNAAFVGSSSDVRTRVEGGSVIATFDGAGSHDALKATAELGLVAGRRYLVRIAGSYAPARPSPLRAGDEVVVRAKARSTASSEVLVYARTIEDPDGELADTWKIDAKGGSFAAKLTAPRSTSGAYVAIVVHGSPVDLDDVELVRAGAVVVAARAETANEPGVKTACSPLAQRPLAGKRSLRCASQEADVLSLGAPEAHVWIGAADGASPALRTVSLEGGRSVDVRATGPTSFAIGLTGPGSVTVREVTATELRP